MKQRKKGCAKWFQDKFDPEPYGNVCGKTEIIDATKEPWKKRIWYCSKCRRNK